MTRTINDLNRIKSIESLTKSINALMLNDYVDAEYNANLAAGYIRNITK